MNDELNNLMFSKLALQRPVLGSFKSCDTTLALLMWAVPVNRCEMISVSNWVLTQ